MDCMVYHHGLLLMCDIQGLPSHQMSCGQSASGIWSLKYCVLCQQKLSMLGPGIMHSIYQNAAKCWSEPEQDLAMDYENQFDKTDNRNVIGSDGDPLAGLTQGELNTFLQKKIPPVMRRTKPGKLSSAKEDSSSSLHPSCSSSSGFGQPDVPFYMPAIESPDQIDLSNCESEFSDAVVRPLHYSILRRDHCFEVVTNDGTRCFACESAGERQAWIEKIKRAINPNLDNIRRTEHQLILFVQEAKGLASKKKYFCEICLDRKLCARTTSKWKGESGIFWAEHFEFSPIPGIQDVTVHLYKDSDKKKKKDKDYIGLVNLSISNLLNQQSVEKWYTLSTPSGNNKNKAGEAMALRVKARFISTRVLPSEMYKRFAEHISSNYININRALSNIISATRKDEVARILVNIMYGTGCITKFMTEIVMAEVDKVEEESLIFRENTIGTKSVEALLRLIGMKYLHDTLGDFIDALFNMEEDCEVDGSRLPPHASLATNQRNLMMSCEIALAKIVNSSPTFPGELREVMSSWRVRCEAVDRPRIASRLVTASLFLRLLCPAIFNPSLFGLAKEVPDARVSRTLTLIAKVIQNLANRTRFGNKEEYMQFMDVFVREKWDDMGTFIGNVSDPSIPALPKGFHGYIDLGKEFAKLHAFFVEILPTLDKKTIESLGELPSLLDEISQYLDKPLQPRSTPQQHIKETSVSSEMMAECRPVSSSLKDIRGAMRESVNSARTPGSEPDFSQLLRTSQPSLAICSHNNSNNNTSMQPDPGLVNDSHPPPFPPDPLDPAPLMFRNPAYNLSDKHRSSRTSLSQLHDSLNLHNSSMLRKLSPEKNASPAVQHQDNHQSSQAQPLSFSNPLQQAASSHHLETVFAAETVTYTSSSRPDDHLTSSRLEPSVHSNHSSLSTRQSFTTTSSGSSHDDVIGPQSILHKSASFPNPQPHKPLGKAQAWTGPDLTHDEQFLVPAQTVSRAVSSAHLKTGLQSCSQQQRGADAPQPMPRRNPATSDRVVAHRKHSVPIVQPSVPVKSSVRRGSSGNVRVVLQSDESTGKYPKFELARLDQNAVLKLDDPDAKRYTNWKDESSKLEAGMVAAPVPAVKSRIVVATANANRIKTSQHGVAGGGKQKTPHNGAGAQASRHPNYRRDNPSHGHHSVNFPPTTPETQLSPEARTAQWVLNHDPHPHPDDDTKDDGKSLQWRKEYEERMLRMEGEMTGLRSRLKNEVDARSRAEKREAMLADKLRGSEKKEGKMRKALKEKELEIQNLLLRMKLLEGDIVRQRENFIEEQKQMEVKLQHQGRLLSGKQMENLQNSVSSMGNLSVDNEVVGCTKQALSDPLSPAHT